jgi:hypothetical protein
MAKSRRSKGRWPALTPFRSCLLKTHDRGAIFTRTAISLKSNNKSNNNRRILGPSPMCKSLIINAVEEPVIETRLRFPSPAPLIINDSSKPASTGRFFVTETAFSGTYKVI